MTEEKKYCKECGSLMSPKSDAELNWRQRMYCNADCKRAYRKKKMYPPDRVKQKRTYVNLPGHYTVNNKLIDQYLRGTLCAT